MNRFTGAALGLLALLVGACSDTPEGPQLRPQYAAATSADMGALAKYRNGPPQIIIGFAMKAIGPQGGTISLAGFQVDVPKGAVSKVTNFTIRLPVGPQLSDYVYAEFGPHGMKFNAPVTLTLPYKGTTSDQDPNIHVLWFDGTAWIQLPTTFTADGRIQTQTNHFSDYGTEEVTPSKGITLAGGS